MKKNRMMRLASALLVAVLLTTCAISGTFAKYVTTASATDEARVAKWGVTVTATGNDAFDTKYEHIPGDGGETVSSETAVNVVAPGTHGPLASLGITGTPEVMVNVAVTADLVISGNWLVDTDEYFPIVFTIDGETYGTEDTTAKYKYATIAALETAIEGKFTGLSGTVDANTDLSTVNKDIEIDWAWPYAADLDLDGEPDNDIKDTKLGDKAVAEDIKITFNCSATVTQVD